MSVSAQDLAGQDVIWEPQPRQNVALRCPAFEVGYGGVKGCGKTDVMVMAMIHQLLYAQEQYEKTGRRQRGRFIIFRKNLKNLNDIIQRSHEIYPVLDPKSHWAKMEKRWEFQSGFVVDFAHLDGPDDHLGYNGQELTGFGIDQAEEIPEEVYNFLFMQVRTRDPGMKQLLKIMLTFNPGGRHADWIKRRFVIGCAPHNTIHKQTIQTSKGPVTTTAAFIPAKLSDNKYLYDDGLYEANLLRLPEHLRRMYLDGDWDVVVGAFFAHAWRRELTVIPSFPIPDTWQVKMGIDWGSSSPACCLWGARDNDGNIYIFDELYGPGITGRTFGEKMLRKFQLQKWSATKKWTVDEVYALIDRQARAQMGGDGRWSNAAAGIASYGFRLFDMNKDRAASIEQTMERLLLKPNGKPSLFIFGDRCPNLIRTLPTLPADPNDPNDVDTNSEDHAWDALRAILMDWPIDTRVNVQKPGDRDVERWLDLARRRQSPSETAEIQTGYDG